MVHLKVTKSDGKKERFDWEKYHHSLKQAELNSKFIPQLTNYLKSHLYNEIPTREVYETTKKFLQQLPQKKPFYLYQLREAIATLDSIAFEKYISQLLAAHGYTTKWNVLVAGQCIEHQVDVIAEKDNHLIMVECKHHRNYHRDSGLGKVMELYARLRDVNQLRGALTYTTEEPVSRYHFDQAWLITNTKLSYHAIQYANCKRLTLTAWRFGHLLSLEHMSQNVHLYPLTILGISTQESAALVPLNIITTHDILQPNLPEETYQILGSDKINKLREEAKLLEED